MPKPLSPEQLETLQANGVVVPGYEAPESTLPAGLVQRALGRTGLPNSAAIDQMGPDLADGTSIEAIGSESFREQLSKSVDTAARLMSSAGYGKPGLEYLDKTEITEAECTYALYEQLKLEPDVVITRTGQSLDFWEKVFIVAQSDSSLNPNGFAWRVGLNVNSQIKYRWSALVADPSRHSFRIDVISGASAPRITNVTSYGYVDQEKEIPHVDANKLLQYLGMPEAPNHAARVASGSNFLNQLECLPRVDTYLMQQLTRIALGKAPIDKITFSWLTGAIQGIYAISGSWNSGCVNLDLHDSTDKKYNLGIRPVGSSHHA